MTETVDTLNFFLASGAVLMLAVAAILVIDRYGARIFEKLLNTWGMFVAFLLAFLGSSMTLIYSEVFGFVPCGLCWLQRVFLYPQVFILAVALWYRDKTAARYGIALAVPGLIIGLYQHYLQMGGSELINCPAAAGDCAKRYLFEFGFVTFPFLAVAMFTLLIVLYLYILNTSKKVTTWQ